mmetsp:Transcript_5660/g.9791  ORF Transcript_5660/g.9791 Transcript_5660/m.9791 type:complete len:405 (+) Transcript_5660:129-1343(+)
MFAFRDQCGPLRPQIAFVDGYDAHFSTVLTLMKEDNIWVFFLGKSFVCPVLELREEMERHKRQKKDGLTPQQFLAAMRLGGHLGSEEDGEEEDGEHMEPAGDGRPPGTKTGALYAGAVEDHVGNMRTFRETTATKAATALANKRQEVLGKAVANGVLHSQFMSRFSNMEPPAAHEYFFSLGPEEVKKILTHLGAKYTTTNRKDLQNMLRDHLPDEIKLKLKEAEDEAKETEKTKAQAEGEDLLGKINSLTPSEALQMFNKLDINSCKSVLVNFFKVGWISGSNKKQAQQLVLENLPTAEKQKLQEAQKQVLDTEALRNSATAARKEQQLQEWAAAHGDLVLKLESMEPSAALQYFEKLTKPTLKKVLKHLEVPHENNASMGQLKDLIKGNVPACIRLIDTADME